MAAPTVEAFQALVQAFRTRPIRSRTDERNLLNEHLAALHQDWLTALPPVPASSAPDASARSVFHRGRRDRYLTDLLPWLLQREVERGDHVIIVNPACVFGRHARVIAHRLPMAEVIATDINPLFNRWLESWPWSKTPANYTFHQDNLFEPKLNVVPTAVVFFGACGSLTDAAFDFAISRGSQHLACRTCCHDNIGGNTRLARRLSPLNLAFRLKNGAFAKVKHRRPGEYFSDRYLDKAYPRSAAARALSSPPEFQELSRHSANSDLCRTVIDLDRVMHLQECGYQVSYAHEIFIARKSDSPHPRPG